MNQIADALADALETIDGLRVHSYVPDAIVPPAAFVSFPEITYDMDFSGDHLLTWRVHVVVSRAHDRAAAEMLNPYLLATGDLSVKAAIEADSTLNGTVSSARVTTATVGPIAIAGSDYLAATFNVETYSDNTEAVSVGYGAGGYGEGLFG